MITYSSTNSIFSATLQGEATVTPYVANVYTASRTMLRIKREDAQKMSIVGIGFTGAWGSIPAKAYYTDTEGVLEIPLHNVINEHPSIVGMSIALYETDMTYLDNMGVTMNVFLGISYYDMVAPRAKDADIFFAAYGSYVMPPNVILNPNTLSGLSAVGCIVESNFQDYDVSIVWSQHIGGVGTTITPTGSRGNQLPVAAGADTLQLSDGVHVKRYKLDKPDYCADLVCIRWTSQTGAVRQHYFPILGIIEGSDKSVSLMTAGDGYKVEKNTFTTLHCRLDGLTKYGYWYYMDMALASDVHAIVKQTFSTFDVEMASEQTAAFVDVDSMETPQGNGFFSFEFELKLKHYGTL